MPKKSSEGATEEEVGGEEEMTDDITLINGDCLEEMKKMPDKGVDLCLTDPPYGVDIKYGHYDDTLENWYALMKSIIPNIKRISKMVVMPSCQINRLEWWYKNFPPDWLMCWYKGSPGHSAYIGFNDWEPHLVWGKNNTTMHDYIAVTNTEKMGNYRHPCPKPIKWAKWIISRSTEKDNIILDPFMGSGTTGVACKELGRKFIGIEIDENYYNIAKKRIFNTQKSMF